MEKKYEITKETMKAIDENGDEKTLHRIKALKDFGNVKKGDFGGFVENESNLSQEGSCWIFDDAICCSNAIVYENAILCENAFVYGNVKIGGNSLINDDKSYLYISNGYTDITFSRTSDNSIYMTTETFGCTIEELEKELAILNSKIPSTKYVDNMILSIEMAKSYFGIK